ncbi:MAG: Gfo/Idh/MocA family protein [Planctomycetales bacterium]
MQQVNGIGDGLVRWGILGTANIATRVGRAITLAENARIAAIASRDATRAVEWTARHTLAPGDQPTATVFLPPDQPAPTCYGSYEALLDDPTIDAVYIPLPPTLHAEWTIRAAQRGKHVLCEKPLAMNLDEARHMADACRQHGVQLMDGVMWVHHHRTAHMQRILDSGQLGPLRRVTSAFSIEGRHFQPDNIRYNRALGGSSLGDLGWYCVRATLWALEALPERVYATAAYQADVDLQLSALLWFGGGRMASFDCGYHLAFRKWMEVTGEAGSLVCDDFVHPWTPDTARFWLHGPQGKASQEESPPCIHEVRMIERFDTIVRTGKPEPRWVDDALATQQVCDALDRSARIGECVAVAP